MKSISRWLLFLMFAGILLVGAAHLPAQSSDGYQQIEPGLAVGEFTAPQKSIVGDSKIWVIQIDPARFQFKLLSARELNVPNMTAREWCRKYQLIAAINAGMFQGDGKTNVGYMKNFHFLNNRHIHPTYHSVAAFYPHGPADPPFRIFDIDEYDMSRIIQNYGIVIQNLRLIKRPGRNRWGQQRKKWSEAALGEDKQGNVLFIFSRSPYSMHDFNRILLQLPIDLVCAQHLEGGPEASLYFSYQNTTIELFGSYETDFNENDSNSTYWPIPNVLGVVKK
jgi:exopolysaccharide biosynthesis protein